MKSKFNQDLIAGQKIEKNVGKILTNKGFTVEYNESDDLTQLRKYDIKAEYKGNIHTLEIKADLMAQRTGNVCVEFKAILGSEAEFIVYYIKGSYYMLKRTKLKSMLDDKLYFHTLNGGDGNRTHLALFNFDIFVNNCKNIA